MINEKYAKAYCCEDLSLIENYELAINDTTQTWECHHRGDILPCGRFSIDDLKKFGLYFNRPAAELIFLTPTAHRQLHKKGVPMSEANKKALIEAHKGVPLSESHKKAISDALKGVPNGPMSEDRKKAISDALKGVPLSEATKKAIGDANSKKVLQFTKSGEFIREWQSMNEASKQLKINHGNICSCCQGKYKSAGGYIWKYAEDLSDILEAVFEHYRDATTPDGVVFQTAKTNNAGVRAVCKI